MVRFADTGDEQRTALAEGLRDALGGDDTARATAERVQSIIPAVDEEVGASLEPAASWASVCARAPSPRRHTQMDGTTSMPKSSLTPC
jgi:hypothetical protein